MNENLSKKEIYLKNIQKWIISANEEDMINIKNHVKRIEEIEEFEGKYEKEQAIELLKKAKKSKKEINHCEEIETEEMIDIRKLSENLNLKDIEQQAKELDYYKLAGVFQESKHEQFFEKVREIKKLCKKLNEEINSLASIFENVEILEK